MSTIETTVMKRVHRIHMLRRFFSPVAYKFYSAGVLMVTLGAMVSVPSVVVNTLSLGTPLGALEYLLMSLRNTEVLVQGVLLGMTVLTTLIARDLAQTIHNTPLSMRKINTTAL